VQWNDSSGSGKNATGNFSYVATNSAAPYQQVLAGKPVLRFVGGQSLLSSLSLVVPFTVSVAYRTVGAPKSGSFISLASDAARSSVGFLASGSYALSYSNDNAGNPVSLVMPDVTTLGLSAVFDQEPYVSVLTIKVSSTGANGATVYLNGTQVGSFQPFNDFGNLLIGPAFYSVSPFLGPTVELGEIVAYNTALSDANRGNVETWLTQRWQPNGVTLSLVSNSGGVVSLAWTAAAGGTQGNPSLNAVQTGQPTYFYDVVRKPASQSTWLISSIPDGNTARARVGPFEGLAYADHTVVVGTAYKYRVECRDYNFGLCYSNELSVTAAA
jgi:hypothetical protein